MNGMGPEPKRQRMEYTGPQRHPPQPPPPPQSHSHNSTLPPPHTYPPPQQPPPPPSPYDVAPHDQRSLPDPTGPHAYVQEHSGHNTPIREQRFHPDPNYSRRSSASFARSPDGNHQYPPGRSMSVTTTAEGQHYPSQYPVDPGGQSAYASHEPPHGNLQHGLPTHPYDQAHPYPPSHSIEFAHSPVNAGPHGYPQLNQYAGQIGPPGYRPSRKGNRATQACGVCRTRKAKCDEGRPECGYCVENGMKCNYQNVAPVKADRTNQQIFDQLSSHKDDIKGLKECWESLGGRFDKIERMLAAIGAGQENVNQGSDIKPTPLKVESPPMRSAGVLSRTAVKDQSASTNGDLSTSFANMSEDSTGSDPLTNQTNAIYIEHDTAAQKLFRWRSIKALLKDCKELGYSTRMEDYVMERETNKGVLRIYGRGRQMREVGEGSQSGGSAGSPANSSTSALSDEASTSSSPAASPAEILWGTGFVPTAVEARNGDGQGGLNPDNTLKLDPKTMTRLLKSYLENIHILHPFLEERGLTRLVEHFKQHHNPVDVTTSKASFAVPVAVDNLREHKIPKRKHSDGPCYTSMGESTVAPSPMSPIVPLDRSPQTALTLLVMALGKICERRDPVPGPVSDGSREYPIPSANAYSPLGGRYDSPPPTYAMRHSPSSSSHSTANTSAPSPLGPARFGRFSPRSSVGELPANLRNVDVIPGLAYYAQASDILGNLTGFHELVNAQCCLLAGLYAGQLANALESLTWIQSASRICRLLVKKPNFKNTKQPKADLIKLAFWTSLQLESDILAELDIPPSGIQEVQDAVQYPQTTMASGASINGESEPSEVMVYYAAQLHMRKLLNDIQKELYQERDPNFQRATRSFSLRNAFNDMITDWRTTLPENLQWDDDSALARTINDARLRGKFYGAQYIIHRPFLHAALDYDFESGSMQSPPDANLNGAVSVPPRPELVMGPPKATSDYERRKAETINLAVICIRAAERSTIAFDGVLDQRRLVVTNIMGTAHAQFGNMLVLSAAFKSKTLGSYVEPKNLDKLFNRTIKLLKDLAPISDTLSQDCFILQCLRRVVFDGGDPQMATSFSSDS